MSFPNCPRLRGVAGGREVRKRPLPLRDSSEMISISGRWQRLLRATARAATDTLRATVYLEIVLSVYQ